MLRIPRKSILLLVLTALAAGVPAAAQAPVAGGQAQHARKVRQAPPLHVAGPTSFGGVAVGEISATQPVTITNTGASAVTIGALQLLGDDPGEFEIVGAPALPLVLGAGQSQPVDVRFRPTVLGGAQAGFRVEVVPAIGPPMGVGLHGVGLGPGGEEVRLNAGGKAYTDVDSNEWSEGFGAFGGGGIFMPTPIAGTPDQLLYRYQRQGPAFGFELPLPNGPYVVTMHFAEGLTPAPGSRVFDVFAEGQVAIDDLDLVAAAGFAQAHVETFAVEVVDGLLQLDLVGTTGYAAVAAIAVSGQPQLTADPTSVSFGAVASLETAEIPVTLSNAGLSPAQITSLSFLVGPAGTPAAMSAELLGATYAGDVGSVTHPVGESLAAGATTPLKVTFAPVTDQYDQCTLRLSGNFGQLDLVLTGLGGHKGHPYLHPVIETAPTLVDYDGGGTETAVLDGSLSHTHEPGKSLVGYSWTEGSQTLGTGPVATVPLALGQHTIRLMITDDNVPPQSLSTAAGVKVVTSAKVPGVLASYYDASSGSPTAVQMLTAPPANASFAEVVPGLHVGGGATIGTSPFAQQVMVRLRCAVQLPSTATYEFVASGGSQRLLLIDGLGVVGPVALAAGAHQIDARFAVLATGLTPLDVQVGVGGGAVGPVTEAWINHDESALKPLITSMPGIGTSLGGNLIEIEGLGFFPASQVVVHWGSTDLSGASLQAVEADRIVLTSPPGTGQIQVTVESPNGTSNPVGFTYDPSGPVPINFTAKPDVAISGPTTAVWGPDGRLYVGGLDGKITVVRFDDAYNVVAKSTYPGVSGLSNSDILGITTSPFDPPSPVRLYVGHGEHFVNGGSSFTGPSPYTGQISVLEGPNFDTPIPLVTQLPTSNHDHAINGLVFDNNGDLLICVGSNTNAGVKHPNSGDLVESPLSAAIVKARTSKPDFNGAIQYLLTASGIESTDQVDGEIVDVAPGVDVEVFAHGLRNPYDLVYTTRGLLYATDNGPNVGFGAASTGPTTEAPDPFDKDEVVLVEYDGYYGSPNRNRGRYDPRQNVYRNGTEPSIPGEFTQTMILLGPSLDGVDEYRARTFQGQLRGTLGAQKLGSYAYRITLGSGGDKITSAVPLTLWSGALGLEMLPGGAVCAIAQGLNYLRIFMPDDLSAVGLKVHDVTPWRGPETGGTPFVIAGVGFAAGNTQVFFDGVPATLTSVSPTRIRGATPAHLGHDGELVDVEVVVQGASVVLAEAYRFLYSPGQEPGDWTSLINAPVALSEVSCGVVGGVLYAIGGGGTATFRYDLAAKAWLANAPARPFAGARHALEVVGGKLYVIGGVGGGSEGKVQIFDPAAGTWSLGTPMPWGAGAVSTAVLEGRIHVAGGIVGSTTVANHSRYDPVFGTWTTLAPLPVGRSHAAAGSDGERFYVIGGRIGGTQVTDGFADVQVFDPATGTWGWSGDGVSGLAPLPQARSGMGKAVWFQEELYVFGGETLTGAGAVPGTGVYDRVDVYDPEENAWRLDAPMAYPRHGISPVRFGARIYVVGGGTVAGASASKHLDAFSRP
jgi:glucose/arabinose dehydrogenase